MDFRLRAAFQKPRRPPREIAFLAAYGLPLETLAQAGEIAAALGAPPEAVLLGEGLAQEEFFYRALADRVGAPFHAGPIALGGGVQPARAIQAGLVYLAPLAAPYRAIAAPRGLALRALLEAVEQGRAVADLAITSPRRLAALVRVERGSEIAARAANALVRIDPALSARGEMRPAQTVAAAGFGLGLTALAYAAPAVERAVSSGLLWLLFSSAVVLRFAATIAADSSRPSPPLEDADLPVYTVLVAMYREGAVLPKLVAALNALDYPGIM